VFLVKRSNFVETYIRIFSLDRSGCEAGRRAGSGRAPNSPHLKVELLIISGLIFYVTSTMSSRTCTAKMGSLPRCTAAKTHLSRSSLLVWLGFFSACFLRRFWEHHSSEVHWLKYISYSLEILRSLDSRSVNQIFVYGEKMLSCLFQKFSCEKNG